MLKVRNINSFYGEIQALFDVSIDVESNEIVAVIGANGAGKTTLMRSIMNAVRHDGSITFDGKDISRESTFKIAQMGISYVPEGRELFPGMTVLENLMVGAYHCPYTKKELNAKLEEVYEIFPRLAERKKQQAASLSGGEQQMVAIARGLMSSPRMLLCDEPSLGLSPKLVDETFEVFIRVNEKAKTPILLVEQNAFMAMSISNRCYVIENGHVVNSGPSKELLYSDEIRKAYLGG